MAEMKKLQADIDDLKDKLLKEVNRPLEGSKDVFRELDENKKRVDINILIKQLKQKISIKKMVESEEI